MRVGAVPASGCHAAIHARSGASDLVTVRRSIAAVLSLAVLATGASTGPAQATDPGELPPLPSEPERPSAQVEMAAQHATEPLDLPAGEMPAALPDAGGIGTLSADGVTLSAGPGGALPNGLRREVLGFLPWWLLDDPDTMNALRYDLLSTIAFFDVTLSSTGAIQRSGQGWTGWASATMTNVINAAHARGVKVVLTASMHAWDAAGASAQNTMLASAANRARAAADISAAVKARNADGVNIDFEPVAPAQRASFTAFIRTLKARLVADGTRSYLTVDTMAGAASWSTGYDVVGLTASGAADAIMVMAYDFSWSGSARAGGVAPLQSSYMLDVTEALDAHLTAGVPPAKMIWGVPYYGRTWPTTSDALNATTRAGTSSAYAYIDAIEQAQLRGRRWDAAGGVPWYAWQSSGWWEGYYDDAQSLGLKYDLVNGRSLGGIGIWSLGMDAGRSELWGLIKARFVKTIRRIGGSDRFETAAALSATYIAPGPRVAFIATGNDWPDALAGGPAAARDGGPMLLVTRTTIPSATRNELLRLRPQRIVVLGGTGVVSASVAAALDAYTAGAVTRIAGADRYATAAAISRAVYPAPAATAYLATGASYADALAGGARGGPLLLVTANAIPAATAAELDRLRPARVVVLGGRGVVSDGVLAAAAAYATGTVDRLAGADRYATAAAISRDGFVAPEMIFVATGENFPDGLAAAAIALRAAAPLLIVRGDSLPPVVAIEIRRINPARIVVVGSSGVVSDAVLRALAAL